MATYLETKGGPLTDDDFESEAPLIGSADKRYSKRSDDVLNEIAGEVADIVKQIGPGQ